MVEDGSLSENAPSLKERLRRDDSNAIAIICKSNVWRHDKCLYFNRYYTVLPLLWVVSFRTDDFAWDVVDGALSGLSQLVDNFITRLTDIAGAKTY